ncbi:hypothetical protein MOV98_02515 [Acinetobacter variabilis]|nr:hypothetical protein MOV98_02515 [Acinetobacter variabilis]
MLWHSDRRRIHYEKILLAGLLSGLLSSPAFAAIKEVIKEASGSGSTQHQAISEALLVAVQSVNGASVSSQMDYEETVSLSVNHQGWTYTGKVSPVFSVANQGSGSVTKFQVLSVSGAKNNYRAKVRAHVVKFESAVQDQHLHRIAVLPFQMAEKIIDWLEGDLPVNLVRNYPIHWALI